MKKLIIVAISFIALNERGQNILKIGSGTTLKTTGGTVLTLSNINLENDGTTVISNGNVGIGTSLPSQKLHVAGNICATGTIGACSDIRYKKDLVPIHNSLSSILALNGIYYSWKKDEFPDMYFNDQRQLGFSAQEVDKFFPEVVMTDANGYKSVDYGRLTPVLVEAIKEQQKQINEQQQQIDGCKNQSLQQQQQIEELKKDKLQMQEQFNELKMMFENLVKQ